MSYASAGVGSPHHLATELLRERAGLKLQHVAYRGAAPAVQDLLGGQIPFGLIDTASVQQYVATGKLRALGVASPARLPTLPEIPTLAEQGVTDFAAYAWQGLVVPAGTPAETVARYSKALQAALESTPVKARSRRWAWKACPARRSRWQPLPGRSATAGASWCSPPASSWIDATGRGMQIDATHDPALRSWVESANERTATSRSRTCPSGAFAAPAPGSRGARAGADT